MGFAAHIPRTPGLPCEIFPITSHDKAPKIGMHLTKLPAGLELIIVQNYTRGIKHVVLLPVFGFGPFKTNLSPHI